MSPGEASDAEGEDEISDTEDVPMVSATQSQILQKLITQASATISRASYASDEEAGSEGEEEIEEDNAEYEDEGDYDDDDDPMDEEDEDDDDPSFGEKKKKKAAAPKVKAIKESRMSGPPKLKKGESSCGHIIGCRSKLMLQPLHHFLCAKKSPSRQTKTTVPSPTRRSRTAATVTLGMVHQMEWPMPMLLGDEVRPRRS
jgi:hypothetical protein